MSNIFKLCPTHFSRGGEKFSEVGFSLLVTGLGWNPPEKLIAPPGKMCWI